MVGVDGRARVRCVVVAQQRVVDRHVGQHADPVAEPSERQQRDRGREAGGQAERAGEDPGQHDELHPTDAIGEVAHWDCEEHDQRHVDDDEPDELLIGEVEASFLGRKWGGRGGPTRKEGPRGSAKGRPPPLVPPPDVAEQNRIVPPPSGDRDRVSRWRRARPSGRHRPSLRATSSRLGPGPVHASERLAVERSVPGEDPGREMRHRTAARPLLLPPRRLDELDRFRGARPEPVGQGVEHQLPPLGLIERVDVPRHAPERERRDDARGFPRRETRRG